MDPTQQQNDQNNIVENSNTEKIVEIQNTETSTTPNSKISLEQLMAKMNKQPTEQLKIETSVEKVKNSESTQKLISPSSLSKEHPYVDSEDQNSDSTTSTSDEHSNDSDSEDEKKKPKYDARLSDPTKTKKGEDTPSTTPRQDEKIYPGTPLRGTNVVVPSSGKKQKLIITPITIYQNEQLYCFGKLIVSNQYYMAYAMRGGVVRIIDKQTAKKGLLKGHGKTSIADIKFMRDNLNIIATSSVDGRILIWETNGENKEIEGKILLSIKANEDKKFFKLLTWHPSKDFQLVAVMSDNNISILDIKQLMKLDTPEIKYSEDLKGVTVIQEPGTNTVTDLSFSKDSKLLGASFTNEGKVHIWEAINYSLVKKFTAVPDGKPAFSINFCGSTSNSEMLPYIIVGGMNNSTLSIWKRSFADYEHVQTVKLESGGNSSILNHVELEPTSTYFIACDFKDPTCRILHLGKQENGNYMFDYITEFDTEQNTISFSTNIKQSENRMIIGLYVFQTKAMRLLNVKSEQCYSLEHIQDQQALLSPKSYSMKSSPVLAKTSQKTTPVPSPSTVNGSSTPVLEINSPVITQSTNSSPMIIKQEETVVSPQGDLNDDLSLLYKKLEFRINQMEKFYEKKSDQTIQKIFNKFDNERKERLKFERKRQEELMGTISKVIEEELPEKLEEVLVPCLNEILPNIVQDQISKKLDKSMGKMNEYVDKSLQKSVINGHLGQSIAQSIQGPIRQSFSDVLKTSIAPMFEQSCQKMFGQISETFENGLEEQISDPLKKFYSEQNQQLISVIERSLVKGGSNIGNGHGGQMKSKKNVMTEIGLLLSQKKFDEAFGQATTQMNLKILNWILTQVDPDEALSSQMNPIHSQNVILALMQQISCDMQSEVDLKLTWLEKVSLSLNTEDPIISSHCSMILKQILDNMSKVFSNERTNQDFPLRKFKLVMHLVNSLYKDTLIQH
eukprot:gene11623-4865_t